MTPTDIVYIERKFGCELGKSGIERAEDLIAHGFSLDGVVEALTLL